MFPESVYCCFTIHCLLHYYISVFVEMDDCVYQPRLVAVYCISELHAQLCPYHNAWPEAVYCCFTRTIMFTMLFTC